jgi:enoyl-CoA hydratase/carnithine racemase
MQIRFSVDGPVGTITLVNPPYNMLVSPEFAGYEELAGFLEEPELKGVIVCGDGRHFCGGADIDALRDQARDAARFAGSLTAGKRLLSALTDAPVPVVAAVRGSCLGAGLEIALACHFRVAAGTAMLGLPESEHGLMPGLGGTCASHPSRTNLVRLALSGEMINGEEALARGLVDRVAEPGKVIETARELLDTLTARRSPMVVHAIMRSIANGRNLPRREALVRETELFCILANANGGDG